MKALVDGLNFELPKGTGIKTYTRSVLAALTAQGYSIDLLSQQSMPKIKHVYPFDGYLTTIAHGPSSASYRKRIRDRLIEHIGLYGRSFKGDIDLRANYGAQFLSQFQCSEWRHIDRLRIVPGLFLKSFTRAGLGLGVSSISGCCDDEVLFLSSPIPVRLRGRLNVLTVHDVIPLSHPWLMDRWSTIAKAVGKTLEYTLATTDRVICVSETTRQELVARFKVDERKLHVVYQPCRYSLTSELHDETDDQSMLEGVGLANETYMLFVGAIEPKKNLVNVLKAVQQNKKLPKLVVVGQFAWSSGRERALIAELGKNRVLHLGHVPDQELKVILKHASAFVFPSVVEGFGLPALEAMWMGVPCVLSDIPVFRELFLDYAYFVDPYSPQSISDGVVSAINTCAVNREAAKNHVLAKFSFNQFNEGLMHVVKS